MSKNGSDDLQTPDWPLTHLVWYLTYLEEELGFRPKIWEPACGEGNIVNFFRSGQDFEPYTVMDTDIKSGSDFLSSRCDDADVIITNPPFSIKDKFLARCYELNKPFALLLPTTALAGKKRKEMYVANPHTKFLILPKRVDFEINGVYKNKPWFSCMWVLGNWVSGGRNLVFL